MNTKRLPPLEVKCGRPSAPFGHPKKLLPNSLSFMMSQNLSRTVAEQHCELVRALAHTNLSMSFSSFICTVSFQMLKFIKNANLRKKLWHCRHWHMTPAYVWIASSHEVEIWAREGETNISRVWIKVETKSAAECRYQDAGRKVTSENDK